MSPLAEVVHVARRELWRSARSAKGIFLGLLSLLGALAISFVCVWVDAASRASAPSTAQFVELKTIALEKATGDATLAAYLASSPTALLFFLEATVWLTPAVVALLGFDAITSDLQGRSIRYWAARVRRSSYLVGKLVGLWATVGAVVLAMNAIAGCVVLGRGYVTVGQLIFWGFRFWFVAFVIAGAWCSLAILVSASFRTPMLSLLATAGTFWSVGIFGAVAAGARRSDALARGIVRGMNWYEYMYPNAYDMPLMSPERTKVFAAMGLMAVFIGAVTSIAVYLFQRRDI